jgi:hypothetical protein
LVNVTPVDEVHAESKYAVYTTEPVAVAAFAPLSVALATSGVVGETVSVVPLFSPSLREPEITVPLMRLPARMNTPLLLLKALQKHDLPLVRIILLYSL